MSSIYKNIPQVVNGDQVIGFTTTGKVKELGWMTRPSMSAWYQEDPTKHHLGMVELFTNFAQVKVPMMKNLFDKKAVIEVDGMDGSFTYDLPVYKPTGTFTMKDTSGYSDFPGLDESVFPIALSKPYQPGDVLTYDKQYGAQLVVSEDHEVLQEGDYYVHMVHMNTMDASAYFDKAKLVAGIQYWKIGHALGELSTQFSNIESPDNMGTITCEFVLGNHRGVETNYTMYAGEKSYSGAKTQVKQMWDYFMTEQSKIKDDLGRELDMMYVGNLSKTTGKLNQNTVKLASTLEYLVILENIKLEANQLLFQKGGIIKSVNGQKRLNEGIWHQIRRGFKIEYSRPGGITRETIRQVASYIFQSREDLLPMERVLKFKAGKGAYENMMNIFREEFNNQLQNLGLFMGNDRNIPNPVSGTLNALKLAPVLISSVPIPDIGIVEVEYDPSLNYQLGSERFSRGMVGQGYAKDSYSMVIWDASSEEYSNARTKLPAGTTLIEGGSKTSNIYYVKPEGEHMWWGYEQGRWNPNSASEIISSKKTMSREFWVHSTSAAWVKDVTRFVVVELKR